MTGSTAEVPRVPRLRAAHRVREIGPVVWSLGRAALPRPLVAPSQPHTSVELGRWKAATVAPAASVKDRTSPSVRPKNATSGRSGNGRTVRVRVR